MSRATAGKIGKIALFVLMGLLVVGSFPYKSNGTIEQSTSEVTTIDFDQINFYLDGVSTPNSDWALPTWASMDLKVSCIST